MPFKSAAQEVAMFARAPTVAHRWARKYGNAPGYSRYLKSRKNKTTRTPRKRG